MGALAQWDGIRDKSPQRNYSADLSSRLQSNATEEGEAAAGDDSAAFGILVVWGGRAAAEKPSAALRGAGNAKEGFGRMSLDGLGFRVKICGLRTPADLRAAVDAGADAVGLNFHPPSPRFVSHVQAAELSAGLPTGVQRIGVFVNLSLEELLATQEAAKLTGLQLHGDEPPELLAALRKQAAPGTLLVRAFRVRGTEGLQAVEDYLSACRDLSAEPDLMLLDAFQPNAYGGTGAVLDWPALAAWKPAFPTPPLVLAGGLVPENVAEAIRSVRPTGVDVASGVESAPGVKDPEKVAAFVRNARAAFDG